MSTPQPRQILTPAEMAVLAYHVAHHFQSQGTPILTPNQINQISPTDLTDLIHQNRQLISACITLDDYLHHVSAGKEA